MKRNELLLLATIMASPALGQSTIIQGEDCYNINAIPRQFTVEDKAILHLGENYAEDGEYNISLYNDNIENVDVIKIKDGTFNYTLKYQDQTREVKEVTKEELSRDVYRYLDEGFTFDQFLEEERWKGGGVEVRVENGDTIVYSTNPYYTTRMSMNEFFFGFDYFGTKYPVSYILCKNNVLYQVRAEYRATYTDWKVTGERTEECSCETPIIELYYMNFDGGASDDGYNFLLSQTLFNDDEKFEYIVPKMTLTDISDWASEVPGEESRELILTNSTLLSNYAYPSCKGIQILSSDGTVIYDIDFGNGFVADEYVYEVTYVITIGGKNYLVISGSQEVNGEMEDATLFYRIDKQAHSIQQATAAPIPMKTRQRNSTINVLLSNTSESSQIILTNALGTTIAEAFVPAGENCVTLNARIPRGVYNITRLQRGTKVENSKILVK